jgi:hypothetical protein
VNEVVAKGLLDKVIEFQMAGCKVMDSSLVHLFRKHFPELRGGEMHDRLKKIVDNGAFC